MIGEGMRATGEGSEAGGRKSEGRMRVALGARRSERGDNNETYDDYDIDMGLAHICEVTMR